MFRRNLNQSGAYPPDPMEWHTGPSLGFTRLAWFTAGFIIGVFLFFAVGLYLGPAR